MPAWTPARRFRPLEVVLRQFFKLLTIFSIILLSFSKITISSTSFKRLISIVSIGMDIDRPPLHIALLG